LTSAALPPQIESVDEVYGDVIMKHPDVPAVDAKLSRHSHRARGLVKPYWVRRLTYCDVRVGICMTTSECASSPACSSLREEWYVLDKSDHEAITTAARASRE
jgi:hypothetical protein